MKKFQTDKICEKMANLFKASTEIKNLKLFLEMLLEADILECDLKYLTKPGDNYGSIMQSAVVKLIYKNGCKRDEVLHLVCKSAVTNSYLVEIFQPELTFIKETQFYNEIIPAIERFEECMNILPVHRLDVFVKCIGSRISLRSDASCADDDALLILENVKVIDYFNKDRRIGFDKETAFAILKQLAQFHASFIAIRLLYPEVFNEKMYPHLTGVNLNRNADDTTLVDNVCSDLDFVSNLDEQLRKIIEKQLHTCDQLSRNTKRSTDTPYTTVIHRDLWVNNIMISRNNNTNDDKTIKVKIYDFQLSFYDSFVSDLVFFLFTSARINDLKNFFHAFIHCYCQRFMDVLKLMNCPLHNYTFDKMWCEITDKAKIELLHILFMLRVCTADEKTAPPMDEVTNETFLKREKPAQVLLKRWKCVIDLFLENNFI